MSKCGIIFERERERENINQSSLFAFRGRGMVDLEGYRGPIFKPTFQPMVEIERRV
jgi:hypothetical protein